MAGQAPPPCCDWLGDPGFSQSGPGGALATVARLGQALPEWLGQAEEGLVAGRKGGPSAWGPAGKLVAPGALPGAADSHSATTRGAGAGTEPRPEEGRETMPLCLCTHTQTSSPSHTDAHSVCLWTWNQNVKNRSL